MVRKTIQRHQTTGSYKDAQRPGHPRMSTNREDRLLHGYTVATEQKVDSPTLKKWMDTEWRPRIKQQNGVQESNSTVRRRLKEVGLVAHVALKKTSVNSSPPQGKITIRYGTCRLELGWLVNCALEWWVKIHSFKTMVGCLGGEKPMKHTGTTVLYPLWNLVAVGWLCRLQCSTEELGFSFHWKATSTRMAIWTFSGTLPFPQHIFWDMGITLFSKTIVPHATELTVSSSGNLTKTCVV